MAVMLAFPKLILTAALAGLILAAGFTLQRYIGGVDFGVPGSPEADKATIEKLLSNRLEDQFCFRTRDAIDHLEFIRSDRYGDIEL